MVLLPTPLSPVMEHPDFSLIGMFTWGGLSQGHFISLVDMTESWTKYRQAELIPIKYRLLSFLWDFGFTPLYMGLSLVQMRGCQNWMPLRVGDTALEALLLGTSHHLA